MFRHEKTFVHPTAVAIALSDGMAADEFARRVELVRDYCIERVGEQLTIDLALVENATGEAATFVSAVKEAAKTGRGLILKSRNMDALRAALAEIPGARPLIHAATPENAEQMAALALEFKAPLVAQSSTLDELAELTAKLAKLGVQDIVLDLPSGNLASALQSNTVMRKMALKSSFEPLGYPIINFVKSGDLPSLVADASTLVCKYAGIMVVDTAALEALLPIMMLRQNIFTDPQKPIQVEPGIYPVGEPDADSPVMVTTNFSLTYFIVSGEVENSGVPAHLIIVESEGMSVLTAWAAGKFSGEKIAAFIKSSGLEERVKTRKVIIPGYVAQISGELEESLPGWQVVVGPQEASDLASFMKMQVS
jgi:acetyl-CoA decarbonylase/synthase complex subunit gamma